MTVCVVGSGAREHALAHVLGRTSDVVVTPGNPGICGESAAGFHLSSTSCAPAEIDADLFVIGPEVPLVDGLADRLRSRGKLVFGPSADGAQLEGSKAFMKELAAAARVPTARFQAVDRIEQVAAFFRDLPAPYVVKTDGLAGGKGVFVSDDLDAAITDAASKLSGVAFGDAGRRLVVEEGLSGPEVSLLVLCDGKNIVALPPARDYKRLSDGDLGPNTGGMGAFSSSDVASAAIVDTIMDTIVEPTVAELRHRGIDYRGVLYAGCMLTADGPKLIEYNVRFGNPEAQVVLPRLDGDVVSLLASVASGDLGPGPALAYPTSVCVVLAADGYPAAPRLGDPISGLTNFSGTDDVVAFHGGTRDDDGTLVTSGGRVLTITALGTDLLSARARAYQAIEKISFEGMQFRHDIALIGDHNVGMEFLPPLSSAQRSGSSA